LTLIYFYRLTVTFGKFSDLSKSFIWELVVTNYKEHKNYKVGDFVEQVFNRRGYRTLLSSKRFDNHILTA